MILAWCFALHYPLVFVHSGNPGEKLVLKVLCTMYPLSMACCITAFIYFNYKHIHLFLTRWENYILKYGGFSLQLMKKQIIIYVLGGNLYMIFYFILLTILSETVSEFASVVESNAFILYPLVQHVSVSHSHIVVISCSFIQVELSFGNRI